MRAFAPFLCYLVFVLSATARADIYRGDNGQLIPGTKGITPGPGVVLDHHELAFAALSERDLTGARFDFSNLTNAWLQQSALTNANLTGANLTNANLYGSTLTNANLTGAVVTGAKFIDTTSRGFTQAQLASTASYQTKNLQGIGLEGNNLTGWDFSGQNLTNANLSSTLTNANLAGAVVTGAKFVDTTSRGFTQAQLASTASYQTKNLQGIGLEGNNLTGWDFSGQILTNANLSSTLTNANLAGAVVTGANFASISLYGEAVLGSGIALPQLYSTASYQQRDLRGIELRGNDLTSGDFSGQNLTNAHLDYSTLTNANLAEANLTNATLYSSTLTNADLTGANLTNANLESSTLTNANLTGAVVTGAKFIDTTSRGFTQAQLASTASYQTKNLQGIGLEVNDLTGWDFSGQNLTNAHLGYSTLTNANLTGAVVTGASFSQDTSRGITQAQLASTASYQTKNLQGIGLEYNDLTGWDFSGQNLTNAPLYSSRLTNANLAGANLTNAGLRYSTLNNANLTGANLTNADLESSNLTNANLSGANLTGAPLFSSTLTNANLTGAVVTGALFGDTTSRGFTQAQLASTASYQTKNLQSIGLWRNNLTGWDLSGQNLTNASLESSRLNNANLTGAVVTGASFWETTSRGFTQAQLASTASYQTKNLQGIGLEYNDLTGWDFSGQNLTNASLYYSTLTNANLTGAVVTGASFGETTSRGFTQAQLASTASYQTKNLQGIALWGNDLTGWDFSGQNLTNAGLSSTLTNANLAGANLTNAYLFSSTLTNADLTGANLTNANLESSTLTNANLTGADTRGAQYLNLTGATSRNAILPDGAIAGLNLAAGEQLVVRDDDGGSFWSGDMLTPRLPIPINIQDRLMMSEGGILQLLFDADAWDSTISFQPGIPVTLGGNLELSFAADVDVASQIGRTFHVFDWTGVEPTGTFTVSSLYRWDVSQLYSTGRVTLVPEPTTVLLAACALTAVMVPRIRRPRSDNAKTLRDLPDAAFGHNTETIMRSARLMLMLWFCVSCSAAYGQGQVLNRTLQHDGLTRSYSIYVPPAYTGEEAWPLVLNMHWMGFNAAAIMTRSGMNGVADAGKFLVVYPNATVNPQTGFSHWNEGTMYRNGPDDVGFIGAMLDELEIGYHINSSRIYATGMSSGGMMSYYLGSQLSDRIAAIASVAGQHPANATAPRPLPVLHIFGTADPVLPFNGGVGVLVPPLNTFQFPAVADVIDAWRDSNNSVGDPTVTHLPNLNTGDGSTVTMIQYLDGDQYETSSGDKRPAEVLFYRMEGAGHTWPSSVDNPPANLGNVNRDINGSEEIWKFFSRHELPAVMPEPVPGDYNQNGSVDAADYVVWRNGVGTTYAQGDYDVWRAHFGQTAGSGAARPSAEPLSAAVPEPTTLLVLLTGMLATLLRRRAVVSNLMGLRIPKSHAA